MRLILILLGALLLLPATAHAASVAYIDNGEVWLSSLNGAQKVKLAGPVVNAGGATEKWLDVAQADNGRIVAVRNEPGKISQLSSFQIWEPDGSSTIQAPLTKNGSWQSFVYPLSLDITSDGSQLVYGYQTVNYSSPVNTLEQGTYVRNADTNVLDAIKLPGRENPTVFGKRVIAHTGGQVWVQLPASAPFGQDFAPWLDLSDVSLDVVRTDVAANGQLVAAELEAWTDGGKTTGQILVGAGSGPDADVTAACVLPVTGVADDVSLAQDANAIAWSDDRGLLVAGRPVVSGDTCGLPAPVVISATGESASIGPGNVAAFLPPAGTPRPGTTPTPGTTPASGTTPTPGGGGTPAPPKLTAVKSTLSAVAGRKTTTLKSLSVKKVPKGATVRFSCSKGCKKKRFTVKARKAGTVSLTSLVKGRKLRVGTKLTIKVTKAGYATRTIVITIRANKKPLVKTS